MVGRVGGWRPGLDGGKGRRMRAGIRRWDG
jgi:hypothetical protein